MCTLQYEMTTMLMHDRPSKIYMHCMACKIIQLEIFACNSTKPACMHVQRCATGFKTTMISLTS